MEPVSLRDLVISQHSSTIVNQDLPTELVSRANYIEQLKIKANQDLDGISELVYYVIDTQIWSLLKSIKGQTYLDPVYILERLTEVTAINALDIDTFKGPKDSIFCITTEDDDLTILKSLYPTVRVTISASANSIRNRIRFIDLFLCKSNQELARHKLPNGATYMTCSSITFIKNVLANCRGDLSIYNDNYIKAILSEMGL